MYTEARGVQLGRILLPDLDSENTSRIVQLEYSKYTERVYIMFE